MEIFNKLTQTADEAGARREYTRTMAIALACTAGLLVTIGALNGGNPPTASTWDAIKIWLHDLLTSTFVIMLALIALVAAIWQAAHGRGYGQLSIVLGVLAGGLLGPSVVDAAATATRDPDAICAPAAIGDAQATTNRALRF